MTPRIPPVSDRASLPPDIQQLLDAAVTGTSGADNIYLTLANHPGLMRRYLPFSAKLVLLSKLDPRLRELVILRTGWLAKSEYEWGQHARIARQVGVTDEEIKRVPAGPDDPGWSADDAMVLRATDELVTNYRISEPTWQALAARFDNRVMIELSLLAGHYVMVAGFLNTIGVEREPGVEGFPS